MITTNFLPGDLVAADMGNPEPMLGYVLASDDPRIPNALRVPFTEQFPDILFLLLEKDNIASALPTAIRFIRRTNAS